MGARFATTSWSQVLAVGEGVGTGARDALERLCETYWYPLYAYTRRRGHDAEEAGDLTQAFFAHLLERSTIGRADPSAGRFRSFLLGSLDKFLSHERERERALKRGAGATHLSFDIGRAEQRFAREPVDPLTPEQTFERRWALTVVRGALRQLAQEAADDGQRERFTELRRYLLGDTPKIPYRDVAGRLGMSEGAVRAAVRRLRQRFGRILRAEIAETLADEDDLDDELRHLLLVIRPLRGGPA